LTLQLGPPILTESKELRELPTLAACAGRHFFALALHPPSRAASQRGDVPNINCNLTEPRAAAGSVPTMCCSIGRGPTPCRRRSPYKARSSTTLVVRGGLLLLWLIRWHRGLGSIFGVILEVVGFGAFSSVVVITWPPGMSLFAFFTEFSCHEVPFLQRASRSAVNTRLRASFKLLSCDTNHTGAATEPRAKS
jgi:hypothetical protein